MDPTTPPHLSLVRTRGLEQDVFAVMGADGDVLIAGITDNDLRPGRRMEAVTLGADILYWGKVDDLCYRVQGALQDSLGATQDQRMTRAIPAAALEDGQPTGDEELDALLAAEPQFHQVIKDRFGRSVG